MSKKKFSPWLFWLIKNLGLSFIRILGLTWRFRRINPAPQQRVIFALWHRNILPLMYLHRNEQIVMIISQSQDGDLVADACESLGYYTVRGSSRRGGSQALRNMILKSRTNTLGITPDGPKGPALKIKEGLVFLAKATGLPVVLVAISVSHEKVFHSWDRFRLPLPFTRICVIYDQPQFIDRKADMFAAISSLEERMQALEATLESEI